MLHKSWFPQPPPYFNVVLCPHASRARMGVYFYRPDVLFQWSLHQHWNWGSKGDHHQIIWRWAFILATPVAHNMLFYPTRCAVRHCAALHDTVRHGTVRQCTTLHGTVRACLFVCLYVCGWRIARWSLPRAPSTGNNLRIACWPFHHCENEEQSYAEGTDHNSFETAYLREQKNQLNRDLRAFQAGYCGRLRHFRHGYV